MDEHASEEASPRNGVSQSVARRQNYSEARCQKYSVARRKKHRVGGSPQLNI